MLDILEETDTTTIREVIEFISTSYFQEVYIGEFLNQGFCMEMNPHTLVIFCADGTCRLTMHQQFVDLSSLDISSK